MSTLQIAFANYPLGSISLKIAFDLIDSQLQRVSNAPEFIDLGSVTTITVEPGLYLAKAKFPNGEVITSQTKIESNQTKEVILRSQLPSHSQLRTHHHGDLYSKSSQSKLSFSASELEEGLRIKDQRSHRLTLFAISKDQDSIRPFRFTFAFTNKSRRHVLSSGIELEWKLMQEVTNPNLLGQLVIRGLKEASLQYCLCIYDDQILPKYSMLPPFGEVSVLIFQENFDEKLGNSPFRMVVSGDNPNVESLLGYLMNGDFQSLNKYNQEDILDLAEQSLQKKMNDVMGAVIGGYVLLKVSNIAQLHDWTNNLANWYPKIPDGAIIYGWHLLKQEKPDLRQALDQFIEAANRGVPYYTLGLRLLYDGLNLFQEKNLEETNLHDALEKLRPYVVAANWEQLITTLSGLNDPSNDSSEPTKIDQFIYPPKGRLLGVKELQRANLRGANLQGAGLNEADLFSANLRGANLRGANLCRANLQEANLRGAILQEADLQEANLRGADLQEADLQEADLQEAKLQRADLQDADLQDANLRGAKLRGANLRGADLRGANLQEANLRGAILQDADLQEANLRGANLRGAILQEADLRGAILQEADLQFADLQRANLRGAILQEADLQFADLQRANLPLADQPRANLRGADLQFADLQEAKLQRANLRGADLQFANLRRANLQEANLRRAILRGANLRGADLRRANLQEAKLLGADLRRANLQEAKLLGADLQDADLQDANLRGAKLRGADMQEAKLQFADLRGAELGGANLRGANLRGADMQEAKLQFADLRGADLQEAKLQFADLLGADLRRAVALEFQEIELIKSGADISEVIFIPDDTILHSIAVDVE